VSQSRGIISLREQIRTNCGADEDSSGVRRVTQRMRRGCKCYERYQ
jgi:hypothetical protein